MKLSLRSIRSFASVSLAVALFAAPTVARADEPSPAAPRATPAPRAAEKTAVDSALKRSESGPTVRAAAARESGAPGAGSHGQPVAVGQGRLEQIADHKGSGAGATGKHTDVALDERAGAPSRAAALPTGVTRALPELRGKVRACFAKPEGAAEVTMAFGPGGEASQVSVARPGVTPEESACVTRVVRTTRFRGVRATTVTVSLPL